MIPFAPKDEDDIVIFDEDGHEVVFHESRNLDEANEEAATHIDTTVNDVIERMIQGSRQSDAEG